MITIKIILYYIIKVIEQTKVYIFYLFVWVLQILNHYLSQFWKWYEPVVSVVYFQLGIDITFEFFQKFLNLLWSLKKLETVSQNIRFFFE